MGDIGPKPSRLPVFTGKLEGKSLIEALHYADFIKSLEKNNSEGYFSRGYDGVAGRFARNREKPVKDLRSMREAY